MPEQRDSEQLAEIHEVLVRIANHAADTKRSVDWILAILVVGGLLSLAAVLA